MGGEKANPTYEEVCSGTTNHVEVAHLTFDPSEINYSDLVRFFYRFHDPTTKNRQGNDVGSQYRSVIFYHSDDQKSIAEKVTQEISDEKRFSSPIVTAIEPASTFYPAHDAHQDYLTVNPNGYCNHRLRW